MRNKMCYLVFAFLMLIVSVKSIKACDYSSQVELSALASNVKANYVVSPEPDIYFTINIYNLQKDIYAEVLNTATNEKTVYEYTEANGGNISFKSEEIYKKVEFVITIYSNKAGCNSMVFRTIRIVTPKYNSYYISNMCQDVKDFVLCQKWSDFSFTPTEMKAKIEEYKASLIKEEEQKKIEAEKNWWDNIIDFVKDNYLYFATGGGAIVIAIIVIVIIKRKRRVL